MFDWARRRSRAAATSCSPLVYTTNEDEHVNARTNVGMQDLSTMGEVDVKGPGAERLINSLTANDIRNLEAGHSSSHSLFNPSSTRSLVYSMRTRA